MTALPDDDQTLSLMATRASAAVAERGWHVVKVVRGAEAVSGVCDGCVIGELPILSSDYAMVLFIGPHSYTPQEQCAMLLVPWCDVPVMRHTRSSIAPHRPKRHRRDVSYTKLHEHDVPLMPPLRVASRDTVKCSVGDVGAALPVPANGAVQ